MITVTEALQQNMDVEFMNVHVRNKLKLSMNHPRSLAPVIVVDVQVIMRMNVMHRLMQKGIRYDMRYQIHPTMSLMKMKLYVLMTLTKMKMKTMKITKMKMKTMKIIEKCERSGLWLFAWSRRLNASELV